MRAMLVLAALALSVGCGAPPPGTGWSRAPDLSVYGAMDLAGELAREQEVLCLGRNPAAVEARWHAQFGAREAWIAATLAARHGAAAVAEAERPMVSREPCPLVVDHKWRRHHRDMLRLLELRLHPRMSRSDG
ncbi:MAG TPA: hypothetical protein VGW34_08350 [Allosphingosinicella sp.]|nr:hypothetical protein [Allosphingosinicella sp.]